MFFYSANALLFALRNERFEAAKILLEHGANKEMELHGHTPLKYTVYLLEYYNSGQKHNSDLYKKEKLALQEIIKILKNGKQTKYAGKRS